MQFAFKKQSSQISDLNFGMTELEKRKHEKLVGQKQELRHQKSTVKKLKISATMRLMRSIKVAPTAKKKT